MRVILWGTTFAVHFNFMVRGEPLANPVLLTHADELLSDLRSQ